MRSGVLGLLLMLTFSPVLAADRKPPAPEQMEQINARMQRLMQHPAVKQQMEGALKRAREAQAAAPPPPPAQSFSADGQRRKDSGRMAQIARTPQTSAEMSTHLQANYTKAEILEAKGDKAGAATAIALSAQEASSDAKARLAKRLGKALPEDVGSKPPRQPVDTLGLQRIPLPDFCSCIDESAACDARWKAFHEAVDRKATAIQQRLKVYEQEDKALEGKSQAEQTNAMIERGQMTASRPFAVMADRQKRELFERSKNKPIMGSAAWRAETQGVGRSINLLGLDKSLADINRRFADQFGEGKSNPFEAQCAALRGTYNKYVKEANGLAALSAARLISTNIPCFNEVVHNARIVRGRVEVGSSKSTDVGPIEVNATGSAYVEFDGNGVSSVGARGGLDVGGIEVAAGDAQFGWNAGGASDFKGELSGLATHWV